MIIAGPELGPKPVIFMENKNYPMKPHIFKIDPYNIDQEQLKAAAEIINNRGLVAFPTETVYGLGANALDPKSAANIFEAKKRPLDDPLIVHIAVPEDLYKLSSDVPHDAQKLIERFWPGPLTIVVKKSEIVPDIITTGLETVAVRMPSNPIARKFIETSGVPIAAPSANLFGRPSPTRAEHVVQDLEGRIDAVIDGGETDIGIESTVIEFVDGRCILLRPGGIDLEEIEKYVPKIELNAGDEHKEHTPGKYPQHYSPKAKVILIEKEQDQVSRVLGTAASMKEQGSKVGIMAVEGHLDEYREYDAKVLGPESDTKVCAFRLFSVLREFDADGVDVIVAEGIAENGLGRAIMNRLRKAAGPEMEFDF